MTPVAAFLRFFIAGILQALFFQHLVLANGWLTPLAGWMIISGLPGFCALSRSA
jgi:branched-subunit amino acid transport protein